MSLSLLREAGFSQIQSMNVPISQPAENLGKDIVFDLTELIPLLDRDHIHAKVKVEMQVITAHDIRTRTQQAN